MSDVSDPKADLEALDRLIKALAHPSRRQVLLVLHFRGEATSAGDIARRFACSWPTTTRHLKVLESAGLVRVVRRGRERFYELQQGELEKVRAWLAWFEVDPLES